MPSELGVRLWCAVAKYACELIQVASKGRGGQPCVHQDPSVALACEGPFLGESSFGFRVQGLGFNKGWSWHFEGI